MVVSTMFMRVLFKYGFALEIWRKSVHCMLQKKEKPYLNKLRIVQLFEADFNSASKYIIG